MPKVVTQNADQIVVAVPWKLRQVCGRRVAQVQSTIEEMPAQPPRPHSALAIAVARAVVWQELLDSGEISDLSQLSKIVRRRTGAAGKDTSYVTRIAKLALLAPDIVRAILEGNEPDGLSLEKLKVIPLSWQEQRLRYRFDPAASARTLNPPSAPRRPATATGPTSAPLFETDDVAGQ